MTTESAMYILILIPILAISSIAVHLRNRLKSILDPRRAKQKRTRNTSKHGSAHLLIVLGSGGHTAEMIGMLERAVTERDADLRLNWGDFAHRTWVVSSGDAISAERARSFEAFVLANSEKMTGVGTFDIKVVPRAREIHQPLITAPLSSLRCLGACIGVLLQDVNGQHLADQRIPDLILCNGPATATIVVFTSIVLRFFDIQSCNSRRKMRTIYVESWARVKKLSLSGLLLSRVVDRFLVQWPQLEKAGARAEYIGFLV